MAFGVARVGQASQCIISGTLGELVAIDFGPPLHSLVICGSHLHELEQLMFDRLRCKGTEPVYSKPLSAAETDDAP
jgi:diphthine synthase